MFTEFPDSLKTQEQLVELLTVVIFTASAQHAAVNFGQVSLHTLFRTNINYVWADICAPVLCFSMTGTPGSQTALPPCGSPLPHRRARWIWSTSWRVCRTADVPVGISEQFGPSVGSRTKRFDDRFYRTSFPTNSLLSCFDLICAYLLQLFLGEYPDKYFTEQPVMKAIETFRKKLAEVTNIIKSRNENLKLPYCYLSPDRIPNSVAIWEFANPVCSYFSQFIEKRQRKT